MKRLVVILSDLESKALAVLAERECRSPRSQVVFIIRNEIKRQKLNRSQVTNKDMEDKNEKA